jgi:murein DD-endopeptidase MepM/ murein hydrolase activator NlpD
LTGAEDLSRRASRALIAILAVAMALPLVATRATGQGTVYDQLDAALIAEKLGLGTRGAATLLLNGGFPGTWVEAAGGIEAPEYLQWPVPGHRLGRGFGSDNGRHLAVDITAPAGTPVLAMAPGLVGYAGKELKGYGKTVLVVHPGGWVTLYAHLDHFHVVPGQAVETNEPVGLIGSTGISRGPHLHFALLIRGIAVDPMKVMRGAPGSLPDVS